MKRKKDMKWKKGGAYFAHRKPLTLGWSPYFARQCRLLTMYALDTLLSTHYIGHKLFCLYPMHYAALYIAIAESHPLLQTSSLWIYSRIFNIVQYFFFFLELHKKRIKSSWNRKEQNKYFSTVIFFLEAGGKFRCKIEFQTFIRMIDKRLCQQILLDWIFSTKKLL